MCSCCCDNTVEKTKGMVSESHIALVTRGSHCIFKFKYNSYKHFRRLGSLGWRLLKYDKTKIFLKYPASSPFEFHATQEIRKPLTLFKAHFFINRSPSFFNKDFVFVDCARLFKDTSTFGQALPKIHCTKNEVFH